MKCFIYDLSNDGIVWVGGSLPIANRIRQGLLDCEVGVVYPVQKALYEKLDAVNLDSNPVIWSHKSVSIDPLPTTAFNTLYEGKRKLASLRSPAFVKLMLVASNVLKKIYDSPVPTVENDLAMSLANCDPNRNVFNYSVVEYGLICGMPPAEAYKEIKLYVENMQTQKIRVHSYIEYFTKKINSTSDQLGINDVIAEIHKKFIKDSYI